jgi:FkbM family methyltransferase
VDCLNTRQKIVLARAAQRVVRLARGTLGRSMSFEAERGGLNWWLDLREGIDFSIYLLGAFEPETVRFYRQLIKPGDVVLDLGANIGAHTLHFARAVSPGGKVFAFEPTEFAFKKLQVNVALNPQFAPAVSAQQMLLNDRTGAEVPASIYSSWPLEHEEGLHAKHLGKLRSTSGALSATLDDAAGELGITRVDFVKLDVDGHELPVLRGATGLLKKFQPPILIELCPHVCVEAGYSFAELVEVLAGLGYRFYDFKNNELPNAPDQLEKLMPRNGGINVLARAGG